MISPNVSASVGTAQALATLMAQPGGTVQRRALALFTSKLGEMQKSTFTGLDPTLTEAVRDAVTRVCESMPALLAEGASSPAAQQQVCARGD